MVPLPNTNASVFSAIVAQIGPSSDRILVVASRAGPSRGGMNVYINGILANTEELPEITFEGFLLRRIGDRVIALHFSNGVYLECRTLGMEGLMSAVIIGIPTSFQNQVNGLLGSFNNNPVDDLTSEDASSQLPIDSGLSVIHSEFGLSCEYHKWNVIVMWSCILFSYWYKCVC